MKTIFATILTIFTLLLTGCASTEVSQVSIFHEWPSNLQNKSYVVDRNADQENNPEFKVYEEMLRQRLLVNGFNEAPADQANLKINMRYASALSSILLSPAAQMELYDPFWQLHFSQRGLIRGRMGSPFFYGYPLNQNLLSNPYLQKVYLHQLQITIAELKTGKVLANLKASTEQFEPQITQHLPYLLESAFQHFPGKSGATYEVILPITPD